MKIDYVIVTTHAFNRWNQRIGNGSIQEIVELVKKSQKIKKDEHYKTKRVDGTVYTKSIDHDDIVFVLEPVDIIGQYRLITIIKEDFRYNPVPKKCKKTFKRRKRISEEIKRKDLTNVDSEENKKQKSFKKQKLILREEED